MPTSSWTGGTLVGCLCCAYALAQHGRAPGGAPACPLGTLCRHEETERKHRPCLLYTSPSPRD
eukprot:12197258-Alexandrium_andersonii.AAC.1